MKLVLLSALDTELTDEDRARHARMKANKSDAKARRLFQKLPLEYTRTCEFNELP